MPRKLDFEPHVASATPRPPPPLGNLLLTDLFRPNERRPPTLNRYQRAMCGIFCSLIPRQHAQPSQEVLERLKCRGPDSEAILRLQTGPARRNIVLCSTVLSLRGLRVTNQPYQDTDGRYALCWNGEAWSIDNESGIEDDTASINALFCRALEGPEAEVATRGSDKAERIARALSRVSGPYAFVFLDRQQGHLYFGRDFLGRRSLCYRWTSDGDLIICSVADGVSSHQWQEIEADGIYHIDTEDLHDMRASKGQQSSGGDSLLTVATRVPYSFADEGSSVRLFWSRVSSAAHAKVGDPSSLLEQVNTCNFRTPQRDVRCSHTAAYLAARLFTSTHSKCSGSARH